MELIKPANYLRELDKPVPTFEEVLLQLAVAVGGGVEPLVLVNDFCRLARETFGLDGVYCWRREAGGVAGMAADGINAARFLEIQLKDETPSAVMQAINTREAVL
jgi:hypothetical protein